MMNKILESENYLKIENVNTFNEKRSFKCKLIIIYNETHKIIYIT